MTYSSARVGCIFDMDGVLVDSSAAHYAAWSKLGEEVGKPFARELFERTFGMHNNQIIPIWLGTTLARDMDIAALGRRKEELYRAEAPSTLRPLAGSVELVRNLHADGFLLAVGSSGPDANVRLVLDLLEVSACFQALATGDLVHHGKPHPEIFCKAAEFLGLPNVRCVVIEDAPQGIQAAHAAGSSVVAVASSRSGAELSAANWVVRSLTEVSAPALRRLIGAWAVQPQDE